MSRKWLWLTIGAVAALTLWVGCGKQKPIAKLEKTLYRYSEESYVQAEQQAKQSVTSTLAKAGHPWLQEVKLKSLCLDWGPASWNPPRLSAQVDVYCRSKTANPISQVVAEACLEALPKHEQVAVTIYRWGESDAAQENLGKWVYNKDGELVEYYHPH